VLQDIAVVIDRAVPAAEVKMVIEEAGGNLLRDVRLFDLYRGKQIEAGKKSLAYNLVYQVDDRVLTDEEVRKIRERIVRRLDSELDAYLRR